MADPLARLRYDLDFLPSPDEQRPGLMIRDPFNYSGATLLVPPVLVQCLDQFNGERTILDLKERLVRLTGDLDASGLADHLCDTLSQAGFLEDERFLELRDETHRRFAAQPHRDPAHAGSGYPEEEGELREALDEWLTPQDDRPAPAAPETGIAAPHVSPIGGYHSYRAAYRSLPPDLKDRTFVILGTSHYGAPSRFGLTRKPFHTPFGAAATDTGLVDFLSRRAPGAVAEEDYCHAVEHSIEFQVVFLQRLFGAGIRILPLLCGSFAQSIHEGGLPERNEDVARFFDALREINETRADKLFWILGVDMAHMGARYGDEFTARANLGEMQDVAVRDLARIERIAEGDAEGFWDLVRESRDDLKWCGSAPFYTFLRAVPAARGSLARYEQWNIDEQSVVSFAGMSFSAS
jgi:AmmeMemoRadiSam system protein B